MNKMFLLIIIPFTIQSGGPRRANNGQLFKSHTMLGQALELERNAKRILLGIKEETPKEIAARVLKEAYAKSQEVDEERKRQLDKNGSENRLLLH